MFYLSVEVLQVQDSHALVGLGGDLFDVWVYFQRERETPSKERKRGSARHNYICVEGRQEVANTTGVSTVVAIGVDGRGRHAADSILTCTGPAFELDPR